MAVYEFYFSPTGGTKKVSDFLSGKLDNDVVSVDLVDNKTNLNNFSFAENDIAIIAVPSYGGRVPSIAANRLSVINGKGMLAVLVCVYGNRAYEDTLIELKDIATQSGFRVVAAVAAVAEHSIARQYAKGRPDANDFKQLTEFAEQINKKISSQNIEEPAILGNHPYKKSGRIGIVPKPSKKCVNCGICAKECPVKAIDVKNSKIVNKNTCISCMRCISVCPHSARSINPAVLFIIGIVLKKSCSVRKDYELFL